MSFEGHLMAMCIYMPEFMISGIATKIINLDDVACGALEGKPFPEKGFE